MFKVKGFRTIFNTSITPPWHFEGDYIPVNTIKLIDGKMSLKAILKFIKDYNLKIKGYHDMEKIKNSKETWAYAISSDYFSEDKPNHISENLLYIICQKRHYYKICKLAGII